MEPLAKIPAPSVDIGFEVNVRNLGDAYAAAYRLWRGGGYDPEQAVEACKALCLALRRAKLSFMSIRRYYGEGYAGGTTRLLQIAQDATKLADTFARQFPDAKIPEFGLVLKSINRHYEELNQA